MKFMQRAVCRLFGHSLVSNDGEEIDYGRSEFYCIRCKLTAEEDMLTDFLLESGVIAHRWRRLRQRVIRSFGSGSI